MPCSQDKHTVLNGIPAKLEHYATIPGAVEPFYTYSEPDDRYNYAQVNSSE